MMDIVDNIGKIEKNLLVTDELHNDSFFCYGCRSWLCLQTVSPALSSMTTGCGC
jgi:hypothetical protein